MGQFDSFTQSVGDSFVGLIGPWAAHCLPGRLCSLCAVMCILSIIGPSRHTTLKTGRPLLNSGANVLQPAICLFGAVSMGAIWLLFADYFQ